MVEGLVGLSRAAKALPRLLWATLFSGLQAKACVHSRWLSAQYVVCRHAHPIRAANTAADARPHAQRRVPLAPPVLGVG